MSAMVVPAPEPITIRVVGSARGSRCGGSIAHAREMNEGTPERVGAVVPGDQLEAEIEGLDKLTITITIGPPRE
jgi:hypothetical protein